nr:MAG TPA: hypothetical protein [Caudoviricetes sp.]
MKGYDYDCKWVCSLDGEEFNGEIYNTREDAVMAGRHACETGTDFEEIFAVSVDDCWEDGLEPGEPWPTVSKFYVGRVWMFHPAINGYYIAEHLEDCYHDYLGGYEADNWIIDMADGDLQELGAMLTQTLHEWMEKHDCYPYSRFVVGNVCEIEV